MRPPNDPAPRPGTGWLPGPWACPRPRHARGGWSTPGAAVCARTSPEAAQAPAASPHSMRRRPIPAHGVSVVSMVAMLRLAHAPPPDATLTRSAALDFALLQQTPPGQTPRNRRAPWWMLGFRCPWWRRWSHWCRISVPLKMRRNADASPTASGWSKARAFTSIAWKKTCWRSRARRCWSRPAPSTRSGPGHAGRSALECPRRHPLAWLAEPGPGPHGVPARWQADSHSHPANAEALASMLDIAAGLRRSAYAGPMRQADGTQTDTVWLTVPFFERGTFGCNYMWPPWAWRPACRAGAPLVPPEPPRAPGD